MLPFRRKSFLSRLIDQIFMGVIVGGAIGSVIGMTVAPKKGKETRKIIKKFVQDHREAQEVKDEKVQRIPYEDVIRSDEVKK